MIQLAIYWGRLRECNPRKGHFSFLFLKDYMTNVQERELAMFDANRRTA